MENWRNIQKIFDQKIGKIAEMLSGIDSRVVGVFFLVALAGVAYSLIAVVSYFQNDIPTVDSAVAEEVDDPKSGLVAESSYELSPRVVVEDVDAEVLSATTTSSTSSSGFSADYYYEPQQACYKEDYGDTACEQREVTDPQTGEVTKEGYCYNYYVEVELVSITYPEDVQYGINYEKAELVNEDIAAWAKDGSIPPCYGDDGKIIPGCAALSNLGAGSDTTRRSNQSGVKLLSPSLAEEMYEKLDKINDEEQNLMLTWDLALEEGTVSGEFGFEGEPEDNPNTNTYYGENTVLSKASLGMLSPTETLTRNENTSECAQAQELDIDSFPHLTVGNGASETAYFARTTEVVTVDLRDKIVGMATRCQGSNSEKCKYHFRNLLYITGPLGTPYKGLPEQNGYKAIDYEYSQYISPIEASENIANLGLDTSTSSPTSKPYYVTTDCTVQVTDYSKGGKKSFANIKCVWPITQNKKLTFHQIESVNVYPDDSMMDTYFKIGLNENAFYQGR